MRHNIIDLNKGLRPSVLWLYSHNFRQEGSECCIFCYHMMAAMLTFEMRIWENAACWLVVHDKFSSTSSSQFQTITQMKPELLINSSLTQLPSNTHNIQTLFVVGYVEISWLWMVLKPRSRTNEHKSFRSAWEQTNNKRRSARGAWPAAKDCG